MPTFICRTWTVQWAATISNTKIISFINPRRNWRAELDRYGKIHRRDNRVKGRLRYLSLLHFSLLAGLSCCLSFRSHLVCLHLFSRYLYSHFPPNRDSVAISNIVSHSFSCRALIWRLRGPWISYATDVSFWRVWKTRHNHQSKNELRRDTTCMYTALNA